jgi:hypothetical protein
MPLFSRPSKTKTTTGPEPALSAGSRKKPVPRLLFLDDDFARARVFLGKNPAATWVQTAADCIARLAEAWDEVHLDHDLGGEHFVDIARDDCGMEVVRWICLERRPHLRKTRFTIHSHNPNAATMMGMQLMIDGYSVELRPFGAPPLSPLPDEPPPPRLAPIPALGRWLRRLLRRETPEDFGYTEVDRLHPASGDEPPLERFDFDWMPLSAQLRASATDPVPEPKAEPEPKG